MTPYRIIKESPHQKPDGSPCPGGEKRHDLNTPQTLFALEAAGKGMDFTSGQCSFCNNPRGNGSVTAEIHVEDISQTSEEPGDVAIRRAAIMAQVDIEDMNYQGVIVIRRTN